MQKHSSTFIISVVFMSVLTAGTPAQGQNTSWKRHQLGFGISTALLDNNETFNQHLRWTGYGNNAFGLYNEQGSFFTFYFDYQYRFNDRWSIEARLKYKQRNTMLTLSYVVDDTYNLAGRLHSVHHDIAVPVTANFRWVTSAGAGFELMAGAGLTTLGLAAKNPPTVGFNDNNDTHADICIEYDRGIEVYGVAGFQFEIPYGAFTLKPYVSLSYSPFVNGRYAVTIASAGAAIPTKVVSSSINLCELECGLSVQF